MHLYEYHRTMCHAKIISLDSAWATLGSTNLDPRSLWLNDELNISFTDPGLITALDTQFEADLKDAWHVTAAEWERRGRLDRLKEAGSHIVRHQL